MLHPRQPSAPTTIAILGSDTVVGRVLCALLESSGYEARLLDPYPTGVVDELLDGVDVLILTPRVDEGVRKAFLGAMGKGTPHKAHTPVIALSTTAREAGSTGQGVQSVPWPCEIEDLVGHIEATLVLSRESTASTGQAKRRR